MVSRVAVPRAQRGPPSPALTSDCNDDARRARKQSAALICSGVSASANARILPSISIRPTAPVRGRQPYLIVRKILGGMQNLILNNMQPKVRLMSGRTGALGSAPSWPSASAASHRTRCEPKPGRRAQLRPGLLLKMFFGPTRGR